MKNLQKLRILSNKGRGHQGVQYKNKTNHSTINFKNFYQTAVYFYEPRPGKDKVYVWGKK